MSSLSHFQNNECILPFDKVSYVLKHPPDRLEVVMNGGTTFTVLGSDCKTFLQNYLGYLNTQTLALSSKVAQQKSV